MGASDKGDVGQEFQEKCKSGEVDTLLGANLLAILDVDWCERNADCTLCPYSSYSGDGLCV